MIGAMYGGALGLAAASGVWLVALALAQARRPRLAERVNPYLRDLGPVRDVPAIGLSWRALLQPIVARTAARVDQVLGGTQSVRRRLDRADLPMTVHDFRVSQVVWGLVAFAGAGTFSLLVAVRSPGRTPPLLVLCLVAFALGVLLRENRLTAQVTAREREVLREFPVVVELLALAVAAGEGPVAALERVVRRADGPMAADLRRVLHDVRAGVPLAAALDRLAQRTGLPPVARFAEALAVAMERGTPLGDLLHAQAADVREAGRRALIESGARREIAMMVPVVFLVLPVTVVFAFYPGLVGLHLTVP